MNTLSILFSPEMSPADEGTASEPPCFHDLHLDQVLTAVLAGRKTYRLEPFFYTLLPSLEAVTYRQAVAQDVEAADLMPALQDFGVRMRQVHRYLRMTQDLEYPHHKAGWHLEAVLAYGEAIALLKTALQNANLQSAGMIAFRAYLEDYTASATFRGLVNEAKAVKAALQEVRYCLHVMGDSVRVRPCADEPDHAAEVMRTFAKFRRGAVKDYRTPASIRSGMNHVEAQILACVVKLFPQPFARLDAFTNRHAQFLDPGILTFEREVQFYLAYLEFIAPLRAAGLPFCYPEMHTDHGETVSQGFDLALAHKRIPQGAPVVPNDFTLSGAERVLLVTGPNQGGKTTFARMFGQLHYLAALGLPIPAQQAHLMLTDRIFTHFERTEEVANLRGKLEDELLHLRKTFRTATPHSIIILNEVFASTTWQDALFLAREILKRWLALEAHGVFVTFLAELAEEALQVVSMVSEADPQKPAQRTYKISRRPPDGLAYAMALAEKHRLTYPQLKRRLQSP